MKRAKRKIVYARLLLLLFCTGQYLAFAHTHIRQTVFADKYTKAVFKDRCDVCDTMHHTHAVMDQPVYFVPAVQSITLHVEKLLGFTPIQLVLAAGRAPPVTC